MPFIKLPTSQKGPPAGPFRSEASEAGIIPPLLLILLAALGIILFILISSSATFRDRLFSALFPKPTPHAQEPAPQVPDEILLKFKSGVADKIKDNTLKAYGLTKIDTIPNIEVIVAKVPEKAKDKVIKALNRNPRIEYAEPNFIGKELIEPNDPAFTTAQWNLNPSIKFYSGESAPQIGVPAAWDISQGNSSTFVAVIDSGVYADHEDLQGKILPGYNFVDNNTNTNDVTGHGTIVSGVVGAVTNNGKGVASLGWDTPILPLRVVSATGTASYSLIAKAINYAADNGAKSINISLGGTSKSSTVQEVINYAWSNGLVLSAAVGNDGTSGIRFPASGENVIAVGATTASDGKATFSNTGPELDVVAPGQGIYSTNSSGGYGAYSGTSYASPHVAALAALIMTANPGLTNQQVVDIITSTAKDLGTAGWDQTYGWGRIQADAALQKAITTTPQPSPTPTPTPTSTPTPTPSDTTNPQTSITSPTDGATVSGTTTISASASDDASVSSVSLFIDGVFAGEDTSSPYTYSWDTTKETNGNHTIQSKALDTSSNLGESTIITVNVNNPSPPSPTPTATPTSTPTATPVATVAPELPDTTPPTVSITYPTDGSNITGGSKINITASAQDNVSVSKVEIYVNNKLKCRDYASPYSCSWNVPAASGKTYQIQAKAYDSSNNASPFSTITVKAL